MPTLWIPDGSTTLATPAAAYAGIRVPSRTTTQIGSLTPSDGSLIYDSTLGRFKHWSGGSFHQWARLDGDTFTGQVSATSFYTANTVSCFATNFGNSANTQLSSDGNTLYLKAYQTFQFTTSINTSTVIMLGEANNTWSMRNSTAAQEFRTYGTYTDSTHSSKLFQGRYDGSYHYIGTEGASASGSGGGLKIMTSNTSGVATLAATVDTSQNWTFAANLSINGNAIVPNSGTYNFGNGSNYLSITSGNSGQAILNGASAVVLKTNAGTTALTLDSSQNATFTGQVSISSGTIAANTPALNITQTWNNAAVTFDAPLFMNITNTASNANSLLADWQVGGGSVFKFYASGTLTCSSATFTTLTVTSATSTFNQIQIANGLAYCWIDGTNISRDALNVVAMKNATAAQEFRTYGTYTSSTNYERFVIRTGSTGTNVIIGTEKGSGGGAACGLTIETGGVTAITISTAQVSTFANPPACPQTTPANSSVAGTAGQIWADANYIYCQTAAGTIKRAALSSF